MEALLEKERVPLVVPSYSTSAGIYDLMVGRFAFEHWKENFERLETTYGFDISVVADAACGTGLAAMYLAERGAWVFACDLSEHMLREAAEKQSSIRICYTRQDMRYLQPPEKVTLLSCATDAMNHLLSEDDMRRALNSFRAALRPGGHAIFDMNTAWQLRQGSDTTAWEFEVSGQRMRWLSAWDEERMTSTLSMVFMGADGRGGDVVEVHHERAYDAEWVLGELGDAGFHGAEVLDAAGLGKPSERTRRLLFVAND
jgi:SAM-dependent methyltransferase